MRVKFLDQAKEDLANISEHYRKVGGAPLAQKILKQIRKPVLDLSANPHIWQPYELAPDVRRMVVADGIFLVFYRALNDVEVLHIRRSEQEPVTASTLERLIQHGFAEIFRVLDKRWFQAVPNGHGNSAAPKNENTQSMRRYFDKLVMDYLG